MSTTLTPNIVDQARELRANGVGWHSVQKRLGVSQYLLRVELEPHFQAHRNALARRYTAAKKTAAIVRAKRIAEAKAKRAAAAHIVTAFDRVPDDVLREAEQRKTALERRTLTETFFGDPPQGWRALDQRKQG